MSYDTMDQPKARARSNPAMLWNVLTVVVLLMSLCLGGLFLSIFVNPYSFLNPFPPPTLIPMLVTPTSTWTPIPLEPTWTLTPSVVPSITPTRRPTITPYPSDTLIASATSNIKPTKTPTTTFTPKPAYPFTANITAYDSTIIHPEAGCNWSGVGGQVYDLKNNPVVGLVVHLYGMYGDAKEDMLTVSGTAPLYGQGAFEFTFGSLPLDTKNTLYIELLDQAGLPLSDKVYFSTYSDCKKNLLIIRFKQVK